MFACAAFKNVSASKKKKKITSGGEEKQVSEETEEDDFHARPVRSVVGAVGENATLCVIA